MKRAFIIGAASLGLTACGGGDDSARVSELQQEVRDLRTEISVLTASTATTAPSTSTTSRAPTTTTTTAPTTTTTTTTLVPAEETPAPTTVAPPEMLTSDEIGAALAGPATDWLLSPSGPTFDAMAAAATGLLESGRPLPALPDGSRSAKDVQTRLEFLSKYPGSDQTVRTAIQILQPLLPGMPAIVSGGAYTVGVDIEAGRYRTLDAVEGCYWETLDEAGEINDNNFVNAAPQVIMTVHSSDFAVNSSGCAPWIRIG